MGIQQSPALMLSIISGGTTPLRTLAPGNDRTKQAILDLDFVRGAYWLSGSAVSVTSMLSITRALAATYINSDGSVTDFATGTMRIGDRGLLIEGAATNIVLWSRDLTNAAWVKTSCSAAKDQAGVNGVANAASTLTASGSDATCLQSITSASAARWTTAFVKRVTGSGSVSMTVDAGATWTAVTVTGSWTRVSIPTQTLANPTVGFKISTSGDAIAVDYVQVETSAIQATSPIATTSASVARPADVVPFSNLSWLNTTGMTWFVMGSGAVPNSTGTPAFYYADRASGGSDLILCRYGNATTLSFLGRDSAAATQFSPNLTLPTLKTDRRRVVMALAANDFAFCAEDGAITSDTSGTFPNVSRVYLGSYNGAQPFNGYIERFAVWGSRLSNADMQLLSAAETDFLFAVEGDSMASGSTSFPFQIVSTSNFPLRWGHQNVSVSGSSLANSVAVSNISSSTRTTALDALLTRYATQNTALKQCLVVWTGHNDKALDSDSTSTFLSQLSAYLDARRAAGWKVCIATVPPSTSPADFNTWRSGVNPTLPTWVTSHADYFVDLSGLAGFADADASNVTYYSDGIHPTATLASAIGAAIKSGALDLAASA